MYLEIIACGLTLIIYVAGFIVNSNHDQVFSRSSLHLRWWLSSFSVASLFFATIDIIFSVDHRTNWVIPSIIFSIFFSKITEKMTPNLN